LFFLWACQLFVLGRGDVSHQEAKPQSNEACPESSESCLLVQSSVSQLGEELQIVHDDVESLKKNLAAAQAGQEKVHQHLEEVSQKLGDIDRENNQLAKGCEATETRVSVIAGDLKSLQTGLKGTIEEHSTALTSRVAALEEENRALKGQVSVDLETRNTAINEELSALRSTIQSLQEENRNLKESRDSDTKKSKNILDANEKLQAELNALRAEWDSFTFESAMTTGFEKLKRVSGNVAVWVYENAAVVWEYLANLDYAKLGTDIATWIGQATESAKVTAATTWEMLTTMDFSGLQEAGSEKAASLKEKLPVFEYEKVVESFRIVAADVQTKCIAWYNQALDRLPEVDWEGHSARAKEMMGTAQEKASTAYEWASVNGAKAVEWARVNGGQTYEYLASIDYKGHYEETYARVSKVTSYYLGAFQDTYALVKEKFDKYWPDFKRVVGNRFLQAVDAADRWLESNELWKEATKMAQPHFSDVYKGTPSLHAYGTEQEVLKQSMLGFAGLIVLLNLYLFCSICLCPRSKVSRQGAQIKKLSKTSTKTSKK